MCEPFPCDLLFIPSSLCHSCTERLCLCPTHSSTTTVWSVVTKRSHQDVYIFLISLHALHLSLLPLHIFLLRLHLSLPPLHFSLLHLHLSLHPPHISLLPLPLSPTAEISQEVTPVGWRRPLIQTALLSSSTLTDVATPWKPLLAITSATSLKLIL